MTLNVVPRSASHLRRPNGSPFAGRLSAIETWMPVFCAGVKPCARSGVAPKTATANTTAQKVAQPPFIHSTARSLHHIRRARDQSWHANRSEEHTSELQSRGLISYAVFCLNKKTA